MLRATGYLQKRRVAVLRREAPVRWRGHGHLSYLGSIVYCFATSGR
jgi:hypothetical protein